MDIHDIGKAGNVQRNGDRGPRRGVRNDVVLVPFVPQDEAKISASGRTAAAAVDELAGRARRDDSDREQIVARAMARLAAGELDREPALADTARRLLDAKFVSE